VLISRGEVTRDEDAVYMYRQDALARIGVSLDLFSFQKIAGRPVGKRLRS
jgi:hypothetical protein